MISLFIFGLGHLGKKIVLETQKSDREFNVGATYRELSRVEKFKNLRLVEFNIQNELPQVSESVVIFNFPPAPGYLEFLEKCNKKYDANQHWIFVSSTSVFGSGDITEESDRNGNKKNSKYLIELENYLLSLKRNVSIVRPGGLIDEQRLPGRFMKFKDVLIDSEREINFIHTEDVARCILHILNKKIMGVFNIVSDVPIKRRDIYLKNHPGIECDHQGKARKISNTKIKESGFDLKFPNLRDFLKI